MGAEAKSKKEEADAKKTLAELNLKEADEKKETDKHKEFKKQEKPSVLKQYFYNSDFYNPVANAYNFWLPSKISKAEKAVEKATEKVKEAVENTREKKTE